MAKTTLDKDLKKVVRLEDATQARARSHAGPGLALLFLAAVLVFASLFTAGGPHSYYVIAAAVIGGYMALNIGANDVANNMGPAVGSRALRLSTAIAIAAVCEAGGAILAGGDVVDTVSRGIVQPGEAVSAFRFILLMMAALLSAAIWIHIATLLGAPVSTTHSIVGGILGSAVAAWGLDVVNWATVGAIVASWVVSPLMGGIIAAAFLAFINWSVFSHDDRIAAARRWVPMLIGVMAGIFAMYLMMKGLSRIWDTLTNLVLLAGIAFFFGGWVLARPWVRARSQGIENRRKHIAQLFNLPLIFAAALLSFAHGSNDVANAVGPLAAIVAAAETGVASPTGVALPLWVLVIGAIGIALGLALFGPRLIRKVGEKITKMDPIRAYCVALSAAVTVLIASALGLPVSSTHIAIGAVFGVGFLREAITNKGIPNPAVQPRTRFLNLSALNQTPEQAIRTYHKRERRRLVRRQHVFGIAAAWIITVPAAAGLAALLFLGMAAVSNL